MTTPSIPGMNPGIPLNTSAAGTVDPANVGSEMSSNLDYLALEEVFDLVSRFAATNTMLIQGPMGCGKTAGIRALHKERFPNHIFVNVGCDYADVGDVSCPKVTVKRYQFPKNSDGVAYTNEELAQAHPEWVPIMKDGEEYLETEFAPSSLYRMFEGRPLFIFLDEFLKTPKHARPQFVSMLYDKRMSNRDLPHGSVVVAASNYSDIGLGDVLLSQEANRITVLNTYGSSVDHWVTNFAEPAGISPVIIEWIQANPQAFKLYLTMPSEGKEDVEGFVFNPNKPNTNQTMHFVSHRSLTACDSYVKAFMNREITQPHLLQNLLRGTIGAAAAASLTRLIVGGMNLPTLQDFKEDRAKAKESAIAQRINAALLVRQLVSQAEAVTQAAADRAAKKEITVAERDAIVTEYASLMWEVVAEFNWPDVMHLALRQLRPQGNRYRALLNQALNSNASFLQGQRELAALNSSSF